MLEVLCLEPTGAIGYSWPISIQAKRTGKGGILVTQVEMTQEFVEKGINDMSHVFEKTFDLIHLQKYKM